MTFPVTNGRINPNNKFTPSHRAWDIGPPVPGQTGVPCLAPEKSRVVRSSYRLPVEGEYMILQSLADGRFHYFGHFAKGSRRFGVGQIVEQGATIAILGQTGAAEGIHTHYEYRSYIDGGQINPATIKWEKGDEDMPLLHEGKDIYTWAQEANDWHQRRVDAGVIIDGQRAEIAKLQARIAELEAQPSGEFVETKVYTKKG